MTFFWRQCRFIGKGTIAETWIAWKQPMRKPLVFIFRGQPQQPVNLDGVQCRIESSYPCQDPGQRIRPGFPRHSRRVVTITSKKMKAQTSLFRASDTQNWTPVSEIYTPKISLMFWKPGPICSCWDPQIMAVVFRKERTGNGVCYFAQLMWFKTSSMFFLFAFWEWKIASNVLCLMENL